MYNQFCVVVLLCVREENANAERISSVAESAGSQALSGGVNHVNGLFSQLFHM